VDLGLIEDVQIENQKVHIDMILTHPDCPLHASIAQQMHNRLLTVEGVSEVEISILPNGHWTPSRMSPEARRILGAE